MEKKYYICPKCGKKYSAFEGGAKCVHCSDTTLVYTGYTKTEWGELPQEKKDVVLTAVMNGDIINEIDETTKKSDSMFLITLTEIILKFLVWIGVAASALAGAAIGTGIGDAEGFTVGIVIFVVGSLLSVLSTAGMLLLIGLCKDVRVIRNSIGK